MASIHEPTTCASKIKNTPLFFCHIPSKVVRPLDVGFGGSSYLSSSSSPSEVCGLLFVDIIGGFVSYNAESVFVTIETFPMNVHSNYEL